ncbi:hypothetical protein WICMUC_004229 [Wickerhamomyces mucosus]|uniref:RRN7-type domain-containing protein n=1 Tax=Wickerhamomyces mucosus TaxID=1378264 RepID=A0A9P8TAF7_9ASCO|nr:hypothetical protein WICMUC_004229 [Wickerhamomyces mucosus]
MSGTWIRGSRCGVDNCRSRYYRSIDGRRICQYGHVSDGHVEYNDEDDENFVVTKRLNIPQNSQGLSQASQITPGLDTDEKKRKLYGAAGRELYLKCYQYILRIQVQTLIKQCGLPSVLETIVKKFWALFMNSGFSSVADVGSDWTMGSTVLSNDSSKISTSRKYPNFLDTLSILYISCRYLNLPIYINDFVSWTTTNKISYMKASFDLPKILREKLPSRILALFEPKRPPIRGDLCVAVAKLVRSLGVKLNFTMEPLLIKVVNELILPLDIYQITKKLIEIKSLNFEIPDFKKPNAIIHSFPEIKLLSTVILVTKMYFLLNYEQSPSWKKWKAIVENLNLDGYNDKNFNSLLTSVLIPDRTDLIDWDEEKTEKYLDWFENRIAKTQNQSELPVAMRRLFDIFPLEDSSTDVSSDKPGSDSEIDSNSSPPIAQRKEVPSAEITSIQKGFDKLYSDNDRKKKPLSLKNLNEIEEVLIDNFTLNFGIKKSQLQSAILLVEQAVLKDIKTSS